MHRFASRTPLALLLCLLLIHCGGGGSSTPGTPPVPSATALHYAAPTVPAGSSAYHVELVSGQDTPKLTLALVGPAGAQTAGVTCYLSIDATKAQWVSAGGTQDPLIANGSTFSLGTPGLMKSKQSGGNLQIGVFQKGLVAPAVLAANNTIASFALQMGTSVQPGALSFKVTPGKQSKSMAADGALKPIEVLVGTLTAK